MSATITRRDLEGMYGRLVRAMRSADIDPAHLHLETGSKTYGRAFRLYLRDPETGGLGTVPGLSPSTYLGMTKAEAHHSLHMLAQGVEMVIAADVEATR
jgi:hypothetical protein